MYETIRCTAVLPAADLARARRFWHDVFDRDPILQDETGDTYDLGGTRVFVYESQFAGTAQNTAMGLDSADFDRDIEALRTRGVKFNDYELPGLVTVDGIAELGGLRTAWFDDSEGNIIAISERP